MDAFDFRQMNDEQLLNELEDMKESMFNLRFQKAFGQLEDPNALRRTKRDIARIHTVLRERQLGGNNA